MERMVLGQDGFFELQKGESFLWDVNRILEGVGLTGLDLIGKRVLDVGAGHRLIETAVLASGIDSEVISFDLDEKVLSYFKTKPSNAIRGDSNLGLPFRDESFDLVVNHGGPIDASPWNKMQVQNVLEVARVLKQDGEARIMPPFVLIGGVTELQYSLQQDKGEIFTTPEVFARILHIFQHNRRVYNVNFDQNDIPIPNTANGVTFWKKVEDKYTPEVRDMLYKQTIEVLALILRESAYNVSMELVPRENLDRDIETSMYYWLKIKKL